MFSVFSVWLRSILDAMSELKQKFVSYDWSKDENNKFQENLENLLSNLKIMAKNVLRQF